MKYSIPMQRLSTSIARGSTLQKFCTGFSRMFGKNSSGFSGLLKVPGIPWDFWGFLRIPKDYWGFYGVKIMGIFGILWESARILGASLGFSGTLQKVYGVSGVSSPSINKSYPLPFLSPWLKKKIKFDILGWPEAALFPSFLPHHVLRKCSHCRSQISDCLFPFSFTLVEENLQFWHSQML